MYEIITGMSRKVKNAEQHRFSIVVGEPLAVGTRHARVHFPRGSEEKISAVAADAYYIAEDNRHTAADSWAPKAYIEKGRDHRMRRTSGSRRYLPLPSLPVPSSPPRSAALCPLASRDRSSLAVRGPNARATQGPVLHP